LDSFLYGPRLFFGMSKKNEKSKKGQDITIRSPC